MLVGKISNSRGLEKNFQVKGGEEKGYFEYGGSTIILLLERKFELTDEIMGRDKVDSEIPVMIGEKLLK